MKWAAFALIFFAAAPARADSDTHYQDTLVGERASGMGGAFTALSDEATGAYYNPAGIVSDGSLWVQLSMSAYKLRAKRLRVVELCGAVLEDDQSSLFGFPAALAFVRSFGSREVRQALGLIVAVPHNDRSGQSAVARDASCGSSTLDLGVSRAIHDRVLLGGASYAIQPSPILKLGVTVGLTVRDLSSTFLVSVIEHGASSAAVSFANLDVDLWSLYFRAGAILEPFPGLKVGAAFTGPNVPLSAGGTLDFAEASGGSTSPTAARVRLLDDVQFRWKVPAAIAIGVAYVEAHRFTIGMDFHFHGPIDRYEIVRRAGTSLERVPTIAREAVINVNLGAEFYLGDSFIVRGGFFTNRSSFPIPNAALADNHDRIDLLGVTGGVSYLADSTSLLSLSAQAQWGVGDVLIFRAEADPTTGALVTSTALGSAKEFSLLVAYGGSFDIR